MDYLGFSVVHDLGVCVERCLLLWKERSDE